MDGVNIMPLLSGEKDTLERNTLYWHYPHYHRGSGMKPAGAIRKGKYKLIVWYEELLMDASEPFELYNLGKDPGETNNLADEIPEKVDELKADFNKWKKEVNAQMPELRED
jgi:arylsulfatase A-like enzyme